MNRNGIGLVLYALVIPSLSCAQASHLQSAIKSTDSLSSEARLVARDASLEALPTKSVEVTRSRPATIDIDAFRRASIGDEIFLEFFPDRSCIAKTTKIDDHDEDSFTWRGRCTDGSTNTIWLRLSTDEEGKTWVNGRYWIGSTFFGVTSTTTYPYLVVYEARPKPSQ